MITKWRVGNFKSIREDLELDLAPLTIFAGPNSAGKSAILQSILLVTQSLRNPIVSRPIALNGPLIQLGSLNDIKHRSRESDRLRDPITIGWVMDTHGADTADQSTETHGAPPDKPVPDEPRSRDSLPYLEARIEFDVDVRQSGDPDPLLPKLLSTDLTFDFSHRAADRQYRITAYPGDFTTIMDMRATLPQDIDPHQPYYGHRLYDVELNENLDELATWTKQEDLQTVLWCQLDHFLPASLVVVRDQRVNDAIRLIVSLAMDPTKDPNFMLDWREDDTIPPYVVPILLRAIPSDELRTVGLADQQDYESLSVPEWHRRLALLTSEQRTSVYKVVDSLDSDIINAFIDASPEQASFALVCPSPLKTAIEAVTGLFEHVQYVGPLRDDPRMLHLPDSNLKPWEVGVRGENLASALDTNQDQRIEYVPSSRFADGKIDSSPVSATLRDALVDWLHYLGVATSVMTFGEGKLGHSVTVETDEHAASQGLANVGVGVSQVLPIVAACLLASSGSLLIFEQPELHLHPKVQSRLADLFLSVSLRGVQCIVETHSEHIINRLRYRIAAAPRDTMLDTTRIYFVEKVDGASRFRPVKVTAYGAIPDWPEDFFDQAQRDTDLMLLAATEKYQVWRGTNGTNGHS